MGISLRANLELKRKKLERIQEIKSNLEKQMEIPDTFFDSTLFPFGISNLSKIHWTPIRVAMQAAKMLVTNKKTKVLDIGSGCGKFCLVASLCGPGKYVGIEIRPALHEIAVQQKEILGANNAEFLLGDMAKLNWTKFDAFYLYNPFYENIAEYNYIDKTIPLSYERFSHYTSTVTKHLQKCKPKTRVVTYHGFGGDIPTDYHCQETIKIGTGELNLWIKT